MSNNYYKILGVPPGATLSEITAAYRKLAKKYHPDKAIRNNLTVEEATKKFQEINEAYNKLKEQLENSNTSPQPNSPKPSDPGFWTDLISEEERKKTSEEAIRLIEAKFASSGVTADDLEVWILGFYTDWETMISNCHTRGEFNILYNRMLDAIERAATKKKNKNFHHETETNGKKEKTGESWGFATKEEADEYAKKKQAEDEALNGKKNSQFSDDSSSQSKSENNYSLSNNIQESKPTDNLSSNQSDFKQSAKAEDSSREKVQQNISNDHYYLNPELLESNQEEQKKILRKFKKTVGRTSKTAI